MRRGSKKADASNTSKETHYVIAVTEKNLPRLEPYLKNVRDLGIIIKQVNGSSVSMIFLLLHIPPGIVKKYSNLYRAELEEEQLRFYKRTLFSNWLRSTPLSDIHQQELGDSSASRLVILNKLLENCKFGPDIHDKGLSNLRKLNIVSDSYPLHDVINMKFEEIEVPDDEQKWEVLKTYTDRELLYRYWANLKMWNKEIPTELIKRYFGHEVAFYFKWLQFFNIMLAPMAVFGLIVVFLNVILLYTTHIWRTIEICENPLIICPDCLAKPLCLYKPLSRFCTLSKWTYVFDNSSTMIFAVCMSFWATIFLNFWRRKSHVLKLIWGIKNVNPELDIRREYSESTNRRKLNRVTGYMDPFIPAYKRGPRVAFVTFICILMILLLVSVVFIIFYVRLLMRIYFLTSEIKFIKNNMESMALIVACVVQIIFINAFSKIQLGLSKWLSEIENPRTQRDYDNSILYKTFLFAFINNYIGVFYTAFFKGNLYMTPHHSTITFVEKDTCQPVSCVMDLTAQLFFLTLFRKTAGNVSYLICRSIKEKFRRKFWGRTENGLAQHEEEYLLKPTNKYVLLPLYNEMIIQYGLTTFFTAAFPLAPLFVLISNVVEMRINAYNFTKRYRRPIPKVVAGSGAWNGILLGLTYVSTVTNALVIATTSQFVERTVYLQKRGTLKGFINYTLSEFATRDYSNFNDIRPKVETCYYTGMRYPPSHKYEYQVNGEHWTNFTWKLVFLIIFEHLVFISNAVLSYCIRDVPSSVSEYIAYERHIKKEALAKLGIDQSRIMAMSERSAESLR